MTAVRPLAAPVQGKKLLERMGVQVIEGAAIVALPELGGARKLRDAGLELFTLVRFDGH